MATPKLSDRARKKQFDIIASPQFKDFIKGPEADNLPIPYMAMGYLETLGPTPRVERYVPDGSHYSGGSYQFIADDPEHWDEARTKLTQIFLLRRKHWDGIKKRPTITGLKRAGRGYEQILGTDLRLAEFWADAAIIAKANGFCEEYNRISAILGGPEVPC